MYIFANALKNLGRNKGRNILLALILFAILGTTVVTLTITNTADSIIDIQQEQFSSRVIIQPDLEAFLEQRQPTNQPIVIPQLTLAEALVLSQSEYIQDYQLTIRKMAFGETITAIGEEEMNEMMGGNHQFMIVGDDGEMDAGQDFVLPNLQIVGGMWLDDFESGERVLQDGYFPQSEGEVLISFDLAELNNLVIGDTITLQGNTLSNDNRILPYYHLTVTGIYMDFTSEGFSGFGFVPPTMNRRNELLTSIETVVNPLGDALDFVIGVQVDVVYYLYHPSYLDNFEAEARAIEVSEWLIFSTNEADFYAMIAPVEGLRTIAQTFLLVVLGLGGIILILLSSIFIRERKYEIGVLRAMGMKRKKVALGLWAEMLFLTTICLILGLGIGLIVAQPISDNLLAVQVEATTNTSDLGDLGGFIFGGAPILNIGGSENEYNPIDQLELSLSVNTILQIIGISIALMTVAAVSSTIRITKYEPIKILMERD